MRKSTTPALAIAAVVLMAHIATNIWTPYGIHRDEFLYLAMGRHLNLFRMEFPPAIALLSRISTMFGESLFAIRFLPGVTAAVLVALSALIARELGGGRASQTLGALSVGLSPLFLRAGNLFQPVVFDQLWWTLGLLSLVMLGKTNDRKWWVWYGIAIGLGLLTKFSAVFFGTATLLAVLVTRERKWLLTPWPYLALLIVAAIGSPSWIGQIRLDFPVLQQMLDLRETQLERVTPLEFVIGQVQMGPAFILAVIGAAWLVASRETTAYRVVGWTCVFAFLILLGLKGKAYYLGPVYPCLFAAGGVALEKIVSSRTRRVAQWSIGVLLIAYGLLLLPLGLPFLHPEAMMRYTDAIGASSANRTNRGELDRLPQDYADMLGWPEQVAAVARVFSSLPENDRARAVVIAGNYGEAGAIDYYGPRLGLPNAISATGTYWFFGPGTKPGEVAVIVGVPREDLTAFFAELTEVQRVTHPWAVSEERNVPIIVGRRPFHTLQEVWPALAGQN